MKMIPFKFLLAMALGSYPLAAQVTTNPQVIFDIPLIDEPGTTDGATRLANIQNAASLFGATAICIRVNWRDIEPATRGTFVWTALDAALDNVVKTQNLNLCIRFSFLGGGRPAWTEPVVTTTSARPFNRQHFMSTQSSETGLGDASRAFAISSSAVRTVLNGSYTSLVNHVVAKMNTYAADRQNNLLFIEPTIASSEEMTYPTEGTGLPLNEGVDYSDASITGFQAFLQSRYGSIATLNQKWSTTGPGAPQTANFTGFAAINPRATTYTTVNYPSGGNGWNWHLDPAGTIIDANIANYNFYLGRRDWFLYRQQVLKTFFDGLASITHAKTLVNQPVPCAYRPGMITQNWGNQVSPMERQGWYDFTSLAENADWVNVAPTYEQGGGPWEIEADFVRSICKYWSWKKGGKAIRFSDESNWPDYPNPALALVPAAKNQADIDQATAFINRGASAHVIMGWQTYLSSSNPTTINFAGFRNYLKGLKSASIQNPSRTLAVHVSSSRIAALMGRYFPSHDFTFNPTTNRVEYSALNSRTPIEILPTNLVGGNPYIFGVYNTSNCDFVTDEMINRDPAYLNRYAEVYLPNGSRQIYNDAYNGMTLDNLLNRSVTTRLVNAAWYHTGSPFPAQRWASIPGTELFPGSPAPDVMRMIWRTSTSSSLTNDVNRWQTIWPAGNALTSDQSVLSANGIPSNWYDFVQFAVTNDQNSDFFQNVNVSYDTWDRDAATLWQWSGFGDWRDGFGTWARSSWPDKYNCSGCSTVDNASTFLDWLKNTGAPADPTYIKWGRWPYSN